MPYITQKMAWDPYLTFFFSKSLLPPPIMCEVCGEAEEVRSLCGRMVSQHLGLQYLLLGFSLGLGNASFSLIIEDSPAPCWLLFPDAQHQPCVQQIENLSVTKACSPQKATCICKKKSWAVPLVCFPLNLYPVLFLLQNPANAVLEQLQGLTARHQEA